MIDIGINPKKRENISQGLAKLLADSYTLYLKTHNYHWNVTGPMFNTLHSMFEQQYAELSTAVDEIAERIRSLGHFAPGSYKKFLELTSIKEEDSQPNAVTMIRNLVTSHESVIKTARSIYPLTQEADDEVSSDLLTQRIQVHEKTAWMLRSLLD